MIKRLLFLILLLLLLLAGCKQTEVVPTVAATVPTIAPTTEPAPTQPQVEFTVSSKSFAEKYGEYYDRKRSYTTQWNGITYHFDVDINEPQRLDIITKCDSLISHLLSHFPEYPREATLCFRPGDYGVRFVDNTLYMGLDHLGTRDFVVGVAGAVFGEEVNYGLLWALGTRTAGELGYLEPSVSLPLNTALTLCKKSPEHLDMNYPCFLDAYADEKTQEKVKSLCLYFYDWIMENERWELFTDYSDAAYCTALSEFLVENGQAPYDNSDLEGTIFYNGGPKIRLVWETADCTFYLEDAYKTQYGITRIKDRMNSGYPLLRQTIVDYHAQIDHMEEKFSSYESDSSQRVDVLFTADDPMDGYSLANYSYSENLIAMYSAEPFLHEYTHYLLRDVDMDAWLQELITYYYGSIPMGEQLSYGWLGWTTRLDLTSGAERDLVRMLSNRLDGPKDLNNPDHFVYILSGYQALYGDYEVLLNPDAGAEAKISFLHYLIGLADEDAAVTAVLEDLPEETFGMSWEALVIQWTKTLQTEYSWLGDYFYINGGT